MDFICYRNVDKLHDYLTSSAIAMLIEVIDQPTSPATEISFKLSDRTMSSAAGRSLDYNDVDIMDDRELVKLFIEQKSSLTAMSLNYFVDE